MSSIKRVATIACIAVMAGGLSGCGSGEVVWRLHLFVECSLGNTEACGALSANFHSESAGRLVAGPRNVQATALPDGRVAFEFDQPAIATEFVHVTLVREIGGRFSQVAVLAVAGNVPASQHVRFVDNSAVRGTTNRYVLLASDRKRNDYADPVFVVVDVPLAGTPSGPPPTDPVTPAPGPAETERPAAPRNVTVTRSGYGISIVWEANAEPDLQGYLVERRAEQGAQQPAETSMLTPEPITQAYFIDPLPIYGYADRHFKIYAVDRSGNRSEASAEVTFDAYPGDRMVARAAAAPRPDLEVGLDGKVVKRGTLDRTSGRVLERGLRASGTWTAKPRRGAARAQRALLSSLRKGTWKASLDLALAPKFQVGTARGPLLLRVAGGDRLCLALDGATRLTGLRPTGTLTVLGGTGRLRTLRGTLVLADGMTATARLRRGKSRGLPAACRAP